ncbi:hypothetical protein BB934_35885 (plasmid) [Microvirga ossetica]|uniref:Uncharacterized protein n=1 Tax=Microvirga ossetica TaxID=1882682 RepID=A0A1B2EUK1_9HYPH|nr:hypothetical protein BB934_35885 [Microvirga ossetica]
MPLRHRQATPLQHQDEAGEDPLTAANRMTGTLAIASPSTSQRCCAGNGVRDSVAVMNGGNDNRQNGCSNRPQAHLDQSKPARIKSRVALEVDLAPVLMAEPKNSRRSTAMLRASASARREAASVAGS